ncbi:SRPBCC domain-containing protein [Phenylobacterium sp. J367]|uniref:SRPBCC family protein n=1 Tax=Phenylobacterium sp. J367 TaxID=2898435 RepID=UPI002151A207|nr:SRPBCC domain-containing protein [Phenylobacterium sp. J367]MCR5879002.1 SRPBCC domain-containing protein [Phenylobacterium sp. J367]
MKMLVGLKMTGLAATAAVALGLPALAQEMSPKQFPEVADGSYVDGKGERVLRLSLVVPVERAKAFDAFSTAEGYRAWATPVAQVDLKVGGIIETSYDPAAKFGNPENIKNQILAYEPGHMLVFRNVQAPSGLPGREKFGDIVSVAQFEDAGPGQTKVTLSSIGYAPGEPYDTLYRHFAWGNAYSLTKLKESFVKGPVDWQAAAAKQEAAKAAAKVASGGAQ